MTVAIKMSHPKGDVTITIDGADTALVQHVESKIRAVFGQPPATPVTPESLAEALIAGARKKKEKELQDLVGDNPIFKQLFGDKP